MSWGTGQVVRCFALALLAVVSFAMAPVTAGWAQQTQAVPSQFVTLDRDRLFQSTLYGRRVIEQLAGERLRLAEETQELERALEAEELALTEARKTLPPEEFRAKADAFDEKVVALRAEAQAAEGRFVTLLETERLRFFERVAPVLAQLIHDLGAVAIIDRSAILLTTQNIDVTDLAIARVDTVLKDGAEEREPSIAPDGSTGAETGTESGSDEAPTDGPTGAPATDPTQDN